jgi:hypothetical protein
MRITEPSLKAAFTYHLLWGNHVLSAFKCTRSTKAMTFTGEHCFHPTVRVRSWRIEMKNSLLKATFLASGKAQCKLEQSVSIVSAQLLAQNASPKAEPSWVLSCWGFSLPLATSINRVNCAGHRWLMPAILATQEPKIKRITVQSQTWQIACESLSWKYPTQKRAGGVVQVVEHLPSKCEALSSNPITAKNKQIKSKLLCHCCLLWGIFK